MALTYGNYVKQSSPVSITEQGKNLHFTDLLINEIHQAQGGWANSSPDMLPRALNPADKTPQMPSPHPPCPEEEALKNPGLALQVESSVAQGFGLSVQAQVGACPTSTVPPRSSLNSSY